MTTWVVPEGTWNAGEATDGDCLLRVEDGLVLVGQVRAGATEWLGPLPEGTLELQDVAEATERPDLTDTVVPLAAALSELGG